MNLFNWKSLTLPSFCFGIGVTISILFLPPHVDLACAQTAPITASSLNTKISGPISVGGSTQYNISGGTRPGGGTNLFHSFGNFNVPTNNIANFLNSGSIGLNGAVLPPNLPTANILGRINGGNPSSIFGMIQTNGPGGFPNANLFLMNPAGFLFGPNATLSVGGMVAFTTADYLRLTDNTRFNAAAGPADLLLTAAPVASFGFLGNNPAAIAIQGSTLQVAQGQSLSFVGGNKGFTATDPDNGQALQVPDGITMTGGKLLAPGGQINIASVGGPGAISAVGFLPTSGMTMGNVSLSQGALLDVSADAAGAVRIRGGQLVIADATISADTNNANGALTAVDINVSGDLSITDTRGVPAITARTTGFGNAGEVLMLSGNFSASTTFGDPNSFHTLIDTHSAGTGAAGSVNISTGDLKISGNPAFTILNFIDTGPQGDGHGGDVTLNAQSIEMSNALISTGTFTAGNLFNNGLLTELPNGSAGNLTMNANSFLGDNAHFSLTADTSFGSTTQHAGDITLNVHNLHFTNNSSVDLTGITAGGVTINADTFIMDGSTIQAFTVSGSGKDMNFNGRILEMSNGSTLSTTTFGDGNAGDIHILATDHVLIGQAGLGQPNFTGNPTGIFSNSFGFFGTQGASGNIFVTTPRLTMQQGRINSSTLSGGRGGNVTINAKTVEMSGEFPPEFFGGDFFFSEVGDIHPSGIFTQTIGSDSCAGPCGSAGNINITTGSLAMGPGAQINSGTTNNGRGGNIGIQATNMITMSGTLSDGNPVGVFSRSVGTTPHAGAGGNISLIAGQSVSISNGASVSASSTGPGNAGNILVKANDITITGGGTITAASTGAGNAGTITIQGLNSPANSFLVDGAGSGVFTTTSDTGTGGNISIDASTVSLQDGAQLSSSSTGPGNTGNIQINGGNQFTMNNASVTTEANQAGGGAIKITTNPNGTVQLTNSMVSASVLDGNGGGGSVNIDPQYVVLQNSQILAQAVQGPGGNINITTNLLLPDSLSVISASSQFGQQGTIVIQSPISPASGKIVPLGQKPLIATSLLSQRCAALAGGNISSFTVAGRDALPAEPGSWLSSPVALSVPESGDGTVKEADRMISDEAPLLSLRKIAPPGFLVQAFAMESSGCSS